MSFPQAIGGRLRPCFDVNATLTFAQQVAGYWYNFILTKELFKVLFPGIQLNLCLFRDVMKICSQKLGSLDIIPLIKFFCAKLVWRI